MNGSREDAAQTLRVLYLTHAPFWREGAGHWSRVRALLRMLSAETRLTVVITSPLQSPLPATALAALGVSCEFLAVPGALAGDRQRITQWLAALLKSHPADVCWIDKTELSFLQPLVPASVRTIVDTHDLLSQRGPSYAARGLCDPTPLAEEDEREVLALYDRVVCIQQEDQAVVARWLGPQRALLAPHPARLVRHRLRPIARSIAFIASLWPTNEDGIRWFLDEVWPEVHHTGLTLDVHGWICDALGDCARVPGLRLHGYQANLDTAYAEADVIINPVRAGAGLKIKSVEALANGLPLLTTSEGARGLGQLHGKALWIADEPGDFARSLNQLLATPALREQLGANAFEHASTHFTPEACFREIRQWLRAGAPAAVNAS